MRYILIVLLVTLCTSLIPDLRGSPACPKQPSESQTEAVLLGPILLGDLYDKMPNQKFQNSAFSHVSEVLMTDAQTHARIIKAMNECRFFIADRVTETKAKGKIKREFSDYTPLLLLNGNLTFEFLDKEHQKVVVSIDKANLTKPLLTSEDLETNHRRSGIAVYLTATWFKKGNPARQKSLVFSSSHVEWTVMRIVLNGTSTN